MRILRVITRMNIGGPARQVAYLHRAFEAAGHDSNVIYGQLDRDEGDFSQLFHDKKNTLYLNYLTRPLAPLLDAMVCIRLWWEMITCPYEILHTHTAKAGLCGRIAAIGYRPFINLLNRPKLKVVHTFHGHVFDGYFNASMERNVKRVEAFLWRHSDVLIALSPKLKNEIVDHLKVDASKMQVVPLGLELNRYLKCHRRDIFNKKYLVNYSKWVGWVGRLTPIKNPLRFIKIAQKLILKDKNVGFVLIGDGVLMGTLQAHVIEHNLTSHCFFYGWTSALEDIYSGLDALVNSSENEGTPVAILEALAAGVPVLATDVGGVKEVLSDHKQCRLYDPNQDDGTEHLLHMLAKSERLNEKARAEVVEAFSENNLLQNLNKIYCEALKP